MGRSQRAAVRALYKQLLFVGRDYPGGLDVVRRRAKEEFMQNRLGLGIGGTCALMASGAGT